MVRYFLTLPKLLVVGLFIGTSLITEYGGIQNLSIPMKEKQVFLSRLNSTEAFRQELRRIQQETSSNSGNCSLIEALLWCSVRYPTKINRPAHPQHPLKNEWDAIIQAIFPSLFSGDAEWAEELNRTEQRKCVPTTPELTKWIPNHLHPYGLRRLRLLFLILRYGHYKSIDRTIQDQFQQLVSKNPEFLRGERIYIDWKALNALRPLSLVLLIILPTLYLIILGVNLLMIYGFIVQSRAKTKERPYIHQISICIGDVITLHVVLFFTYVRYLNLYVYVPCWLFQYGVRWPFFDLCSTLVSPCLLIVATQDRIDGIRRFADYLARDHERKAKKVAAVTAGLYLSAVIFFNWLAGPPFEQQRQIDQKSSASLVRPTIHRCRVYCMIKQYPALYRHDRLTCSPSKSQCQEEAYPEGDIKDLIEDPLKAQRRTFCNAFGDQSTFPLSYLPENRQQGNTFNGLAFRDKYSRRLDLRLPCFYDSVAMPGPVYLVFAGLSIFLVVVMAYLGISLAVFHKQAKVKSAKLRGEHKTYQHSNLVFYSIAIQVTVQVALLSFVSVYSAENWLINYCDVNYPVYDYGGNSVHRHDYPKFCININSMKTYRFLMIGTFAFGFISYVQNFFIFLALSKTYRQTLLGIFGKTTE